MSRWKVWLLGALLLVEWTLLLCVANGVAVAPPLLAAGGLAVLAGLTAHLWDVVRAYRAARRSGTVPRAAAARALDAAVPAVVRRLARHEFALLGAQLRWLTRRPPHGAGPGDTVGGYAAAQSALMYALILVSVVETVALAYLIPWPAVHLVVLVLDVWGVLFALGLHASCVTRPHLVGADGSLRVRYGALVDIRTPAGGVTAVRLDRRFPRGGGLVRVDADGTAELAVAGQTNVTVELAEPVEFRRPLGAVERAGTLRFWVDDPEPVVAALRGAARPTGPWDGAPERTT
ncbi:hypothetical protein E0L36_15415 [Streptomyces sp. AJS327]|uniref:hypothetical protein n=1 Tax=Streptomyces sp. AJS327 TaxID=2545265 RepID=UPI0015DF76EF|nr:hypothetical protein [Streptomyces sp. AJS327]MBA0052242.1 hypothetical protein [Streptomyces sp. AJS327]